MTALLSEETYRAVHTTVRGEHQGRLNVKGMSEPVHVYRAVELIGANAHVRDSAVRESAPLVGRVDELATIRRLLDRLNTGAGGLIVLVGEPGVGKSRLLTEVRHMATAAGFAWLQGHALSFGQTISYWPFLETARARSIPPGAVPGPHAAIPERRRGRATRRASAGNRRASNGPVHADPCEG
jgi:AAA ATPase-like protein